MTWSVSAVGYTPPLISSPSTFTNQPAVQRLSVMPCPSASCARVSTCFVSVLASAESRNQAVALQHPCCCSGVKCSIQCRVSLQLLCRECGEPESDIDGERVETRCAAVSCSILLIPLLSSPAHGSITQQQLVGSMEQVQCRVQCSSIGHLGPESGTPNQFCRWRRGKWNCSS